MKLEKILWVIFIGLGVVLVLVNWFEQRQKIRQSAANARAAKEAKRTEKMFHINSNDDGNEPVWESTPENNAKGD